MAPVPAHLIPIMLAFHIERKVGGLRNCQHIGQSSSLKGLDKGLVDIGFFQS